MQHAANLKWCCNLHSSSPFFESITEQYINLYEKFNLIFSIYMSNHGKNNLELDSPSPHTFLI